MVEESFKVVRVDQTHIRDFRSHIAQYFKKTTKRGSETYKVSQYKMFTFSTAHPFDVEVSRTMMGLDRMKFGLLKPNAQLTLPTNQCYRGQLPVQPAKLKDIKNLKKYLKEATRELVDQLTTSDELVSNDGNSDYED